MGAKAGVDETVLHGLGIEHRHLPPRAFERKRFGRGVIRAFFAKGRIFNAAHRRREPHPALAVEHTVVIVRPLAPDFLLTPVGRSVNRFERGIGM